MNRPGLVWGALFVAAMQLPAAAQQADAPPGAAGLHSVLEDDDRFSQLLTEVWVLRDILALHLGGNISAEVQEFQRMQDRLKEQRAAILEKVGSKSLPQTTSVSIGRFAATLEKTGVKPDSELGRRLVVASILFEQAASAGSLGSLCDMHPFRAVCSEQ